MGSFEHAVSTAAASAHPALTDWVGVGSIECNLHRWIREEPRWVDPLTIELDDSAIVVSRRVVAEASPGSIAGPAILVARSVSAIDSLLNDLASSPEMAGCEYIGAFVAHDTPATEDMLQTHSRMTPFKYVLTGRLAEMRTDQRRPPTGSAIRMQAPEDFDFYPEYAAMYERFNEDVPQLREVVPVEPLDLLQRFHETGCLRLVMVDDEFAGVMAATRECRFGCSGWMMRERILARRFRGRGLGAPVLDAFLRGLDAHDDDLLFGTIAHGNEPSLASAMKLGRVNIGGLYNLRLSRGA